MPHRHDLAASSMPDEHHAPIAADETELRDPGLYRLGVGQARDGLVAVPPGYRPGIPTPLAVMLHGAGADAATIIPLLRPHTDAAGVLLLAPDSRGRTWDAITGHPGPDIAFMNAAVRAVYNRLAAPPNHVALAGFSDGATYALSVGLANGDLFGHILAFSPGFVTPLGRQGRPRIFMSHGASDPVLNIDDCSRTIHPHLIKAGYDVVFREFDDGHTVPPEIAAEAVRWWLA